MINQKEQSYSLYSPHPPLQFAGVHVLQAVVYASMMVLNCPSINGRSLAKTANRFEINSLVEKILLKQVRWCLTFVGLYMLNNHDC